MNKYIFIRKMGILARCVVQVVKTDQFYYKASHGIPKTSELKNRTKQKMKYKIDYAFKLWES